MLVFAVLLIMASDADGSLESESHATQDKNLLEHQYHLFTYLFNSSRYNPRCDPTVLEAINISFYLELQSLLSLDENTQTVRMNAWLQEDWKDAQLFWNPSDYGGITNIATPYDDVWRPQVFLTNSVEMDKAQTETPTVVSITIDTEKDPSHAFMMFGYKAIFKYNCPINMWLFPFDIQKCTMIFEPVLDVSRLRFNIDVDAVNTKYYRQNEEWALVSTTLTVNDMYYDTAPIPFSRIHAAFYLRRRPMYYVVSLILPMILISLFSAIGLFVPVDTPECTYDKLSLGMTALLTFSIQLLQVSSQVPKGSSTVPLLSWFFLGMMTQITISTLVAVWLCDPAACEKVKRYYVTCLSCFGVCSQGKRQLSGHSLQKRPTIFYLHASRRVAPVRDRVHSRAQDTQFFAHMLFMAFSVVTMLGLIGGIFLMACFSTVEES